MQGTETATASGVDESLDVVLSDGRSLHLAGLDPPQPTPANEDFPNAARQAFAARLAGGAVSFLPLAEAPDRWGRIPAFVFFAANPSGGSAVSAAIFLLAHGFARFMPVPEAHPCRLQFLAAESGARRARLGLWRDPYYAILTPTDRAAFVEHAAENVVVEGRLVNVISDSYRSSLEFEPPGTRALSVTILQRNVAMIDRSGLHFHALIGRILRVRGLLDLRFGPHIEIAGADDVEVIADEQKQGGPASHRETEAAPPPKHYP